MRFRPVRSCSEYECRVNVLLKVLADAARILGDDYDVEIVRHTTTGKGCAERNAMKMAQVIAESLGRDIDQVGVYNRRE